MVGPASAAQAAPGTPPRGRLSERQKHCIAQLLWEQLEPVRAKLGPDMACHIVGSAIRAVSLISHALPKTSNQLLAAAFLNCGAVMAGCQLGPEIDIIRSMCSGSADVEWDIMQAMRP
jgi:hypothetical protein